MKNDIALLIPILVPLAFFALVFGVVYLNKRENLAMIDKGMNPKKGAQGPQPFRYLKWGLLLVGSGLGLLLAYFIDTIVRSNDPEALYFGLIAIGGGFGLIFSYRMEMKAMKEWKRYETSERTTAVQAPSEV